MRGRCIVMSPSHSLTDNFVIDRAREANLSVQCFEQVHEIWQCKGHDRPDTGSS